jgi:hypothetical protein
MLHLRDCLCGPSVVKVKRIHNALFATPVLRIRLGDHSAVSRIEPGLKNQYQFYQFIDPREIDTATFSFIWEELTNLMQFSTPSMDI